MTPITSTSITPTTLAPSSTKSNVPSIGEINPNRENTMVGLDSSRRTNAVGISADIRPGLNMSTTNLAAMSQERRAEQNTQTSNANQAQRYQTMQAQMVQGFRDQDNVSVMA